MKTYRVYKRETKHNVTFFVKTVGARYVPYGKLIGHIDAMSQDVAVAKVKTLTESGLLALKEYTRVPTDTKSNFGQI